MKTLKVDDKWSIEYDPDNNDRPNRVLRYGTLDQHFPMNRLALAMFHELLKERPEPSGGLDNFIGTGDAQ